MDDSNKLHLGADLDAELVKRFRNKAKKLDLKSKRLLQRLIEWWLDQEPEVQVQMYHQLDNRSMLSVIIDQKLKTHEKILHAAMNQMLADLSSELMNRGQQDPDLDEDPQIISA